MRLPSITLWSQVLRIEDVSEVLVSIQRPIGQQLAMRTNIWLASNTILCRVACIIVTVLSIVLRRVAFNQRCLQIGRVVVFLFTVEGTSVLVASFARLSTARVKVDMDLACMLLKCLGFVLFRNHLVAVVALDLLAGHVFGDFIALGWHAVAALALLATATFRRLEQTLVWFA